LVPTEELGLKMSPVNVVTVEMLAGLPEPVRKYLKWSKVLGKPLVRRVTVKQTGRIRQSPQKPWMQFRATESYSIDPPGFVWDASAGYGRLPLFTVRDSYADGKGSMRVKLAGLFPVVNARGSEMDHSCAIRFLNEMMWFPSAFLHSNISWQAIDDNSAEVSLLAHARTVSAKLFFDPDGRITNFFARRYKDIGTDSEPTRWSTPITAYRTFCGLRLPAAGQAVWHLESGDFTYIDLRVDEITYDSDGS
jgi:uncharacterized protein DUF6544